MSKLKNIIIFRFKFNFLSFSIARYVDTPENLQDKIEFETRGGACCVKLICHILCTAKL